MAIVTQTKQPIIEDLFSIAYDKWGLIEEEVRIAVKQAGFEKWNPEYYEEYLSKCQWYFLRKQLVETQTLLEKRIAELNELRRLESMLTIEVKLDCWIYVGSEKELAAHWELERLRRETKRRRLSIERCK